MQKPFAIAATLGVIGFILLTLLLVFSPQENKPVLKSAEVLTEDQYIEKHLKAMTVEEKVRQLFIWTVTGPDVPEADIKQLEALKPGGVMISGTMDHTQLLRLTVQLRALKLPVPLIIAIDQEGGAVRRLNEDTLGDAHILGTATDQQFCEDIRDSSRWLSELGVNLNFGIIADVAWTEDSYMYNRSYGSEQQGVANHVAEAIRCTSGVMTTIKHFPGHGRTALDSHFTLPSIVLSYDEWKKTDAVPFQVGIQNNVHAIMMGHLIYSDIASEPASLSSRWVGETRKMGFTGLVITDDMGMLEATGLNPVESMKRAILAGNDVLLYANTQADKEELVKQAMAMVQNKEISEEQLNEHVRRILKVKYRF